MPFREINSRLLQLIIENSQEHSELRLPRPPDHPVTINFSTLRDSDFESSEEDSDLVVSSTLRDADFESSEEDSDLVVEKNMEEPLTENKIEELGGYMEISPTIISQQQIYEYANGGNEESHVASESFELEGLDEHSYMKCLK